MLACGVFLNLLILFFAKRVRIIPPQFSQTRNSCIWKSAKFLFICQDAFVVLRGRWTLLKGRLSHLGNFASGCIRTSFFRILPTLPRVLQVASSYHQHSLLSPCQALCSPTPEIRKDFERAGQKCFQREENFHNLQRCSNVDIIFSEPDSYAWSYWCLLTASTQENIS